MTLITVKILLVDDCLKDREIYRSYLLDNQQQNYRILEADTGEQALLLCQQELPDVIVTDYLLPDIDALKFLNSLKREFSQTKPPVIILTNRGNERIAVQAMKSGAADYLVKKSTTKLNFIKSVENLLEKTHRTRQLDKRIQNIRVLKQTQAALQEANSELEKRVQHRTSELQKTNQELRRTLEELQVTQEELRQQNEVLAISRHALQQKNELLQTIFDHVPVMVVLLNSNGRIQWANREWETVLGWRVQEIQGRDMVPEFYPNPQYRRYVLDFIAAGERQWGEFKTRTRDGRIIDTTWANIRLTDGTIIGIGQDISERKQAEQKLRRSEEQRRLVLDLTHTGFWDWNITTGEIIWNDNLYYLLGLIPNSVESGYQTWRDRVHPEDIDQVEQALNHALDHQKDFKLEYRVIYPDGSHHWLMARGRGLYDESGKAVRMIGMLFDITERKCREANAAFLAEIAEDLSRLSSAEDIMHTVGAKVGTYLGISGCFLAEINEVEDQAIVEYTWHTAGTLDLMGVHRLSDFINDEFQRAARSGETVIIRNTQTDPRTNKDRYAALQIYAYVTVPFHRDGEWKYLFTVHDSVARDWSESEIELIGEVTNRTFPRLERARAEAAVAQDLKDTQLLRDLSTRLISEDNIQVLYDEIVTAAIVLMKADAGCFQILDEVTQELVILASQNLDCTMIEHFARVDTSFNISCGIALATGERSFIHFDVPESEDPKGYLRIFVKTGYFCAQSTPLISRSGKLIGMVSTHWRNHHRLSDRELRFLDLLARQAADLIEQRQADLEIRRFVSLADNSTEFIGMCDMNFQPFYLNPAGMQLIGLDESQYRKVSVRECFFPEDQDFIINEFFSRVFREGRAEVEIRFRHFKTGQALWMLYSVFCIKDKNDGLIGLATVSRNITESKLAQEKIQEQAALLDVATEAIFVCDLGYHILYWNPGAERMYGWQGAEVLRKDCRQLLYKEISPSVQEALTTVIEQGEWQGELNKITKFGQEIIVSSHWTLMRDAMGRPKSFFAVDTNITEKKQLEAQFYRAQRLESLGTLASGIAHDLNNILTPILAVAQLLPLKLPDLNEQNRQLLKILEDNSKRGAQLVRQILSFARGEQGKRIPLQLKSLLKEFEQVIKSTFPKSIEISTKIATPNLWTVLADPTQIHQVLMNLCVNARDAMPDGGTLSISAHNFHADENYARMNLEAKEGDYVVVTVSDTGCGMSQEVQERIFEPFFTTKEPGKGTGLGLSTIIGIIKNHGGFVNVSSEVGKGSQFQVFLSAIETSVSPESNELQMSSGNGELILVVDDEAFVRDLVKASLEECNYKVLIAKDSIDAFSLYVQHTNEISLVLMDIQMPSIDGFKAIRVLQQINPKVKIIAMSGLTSNRDLLKVSSISVRAFLPKPYTIKELLDTMKGVLDSP
ncbi:PAS domain S-box protein [Aetokthonos hydrillicola Thurmond2011]|uniref:histidine kinase n=1 Tax=Aetokthonos hydrillicola Thurmond2011 TaxID=2712845 RepID=A0AAP5IGY3_9CYAN|nr:PAS domain S-box protein [Aetokthonos hydrillicola]MDR9899190.1 PAS domain S-box protein [Aetokthonos hydrillicola Thurmond2011]